MVMNRMTNSSTSSNINKTVSQSISRILQQVADDANLPLPKVFGANYFLFKFPISKNLQKLKWHFKGKPKASFHDERIELFANNVDIVIKHHFRRDCWCVFKAKIEGGIFSGYELKMYEYIMLPEPTCWVGDNPKRDYYSALFHELTHATGTPMKRIFPENKECFDYYYEEVVAEMGSAYLLDLFSLSDDTARQRSADYVRYFTTMALESIRNKPMYYKGFLGENATLEQKADMIIRLAISDVESAMDYLFKTFNKNFKANNLKF
jgi:Zincin-like metallopeptidase